MEHFLHQNKTSVRPDLHCYNIQCDYFAIDIHKASTKAIYKCFINFKYQTPVALWKWEDIIQTTTDWHQVLKLTYHCSSETQLQTLQYHKIRRFLPCKKWFCDISIIFSNMRDKCNTVDTIEHNIFLCKSAKPFRSETI